MKLTDLNIDCLLRIFKYCSECELINLCQANNYLCAIIERNIFYAMSKDLLLCGHRNSTCVDNRNQSKLSYLERLQISRNWLSGTYLERQYYHHAQMFPSKLYIDSDALYITHANYLRKYRRDGSENLQRRFDEEISTPTISDISHFVKKEETIFAGRVCGTCFISDENGITEQLMHSPREYLYCVDFVNDVYASSTDTCCKLWRRSQEFGLTHFDLLLHLEHSFKSTKFSADGHWLYGGLYSDKEERRALRAINVDSGKHITLNSNSISIYDLKIKDDHVLFTANFDTTFRMFDRRSERDVSIWEDPFDSSLYCLEYDGLYAVLCGAKHHSRVNLYDIRVPGKYIQLYFPGCTRRQHNRSSPVYSLTCDNQYMFVATDHNLRVFDFKTNYGIQRDYSHFYDYSNG